MIAATQLGCPGRKIQRLRNLAIAGTGLPDIIGPACFFREYEDRKRACTVWLGTRVQTLD